MWIGAPHDDRFALAGPGAAQVGDRGLGRGGHSGKRGKYGDPSKLRHDWPPSVTGDVRIRRSCGDDALSRDAAPATSWNQVTAPRSSVRNRSRFAANAVRTRERRWTRCGKHRYPPAIGRPCRCVPDRRTLVLAALFRISVLACFRPSASSASPKRPWRRSICSARSTASSASPATRCGRRGCARRSRGSPPSSPPTSTKILALEPDLVLHLLRPAGRHRRRADPSQRHRARLQPARHRRHPRDDPHARRAHRVQLKAEALAQALEQRLTRRACGARAAARAARASISRNGTSR